MAFLQFNFLVQLFLDLEVAVMNNNYMKQRKLCIASISGLHKTYKAIIFQPSFSVKLIVDRTVATDQIKA